LEDEAESEVNKVLFEITEGQLGALVTTTNTTGKHKEVEAEAVDAKEEDVATAAMKERMSKLSS
jgi:hypothetical protein